MKIRDLVKKVKARLELANFVIWLASATIFLL